MRRTRGCALAIAIVSVALGLCLGLSETCIWTDWARKRKRSFELDARAPAWRAAFARSEDIIVDRGCPGHPEWKIAVRAHEDVTYVLLGGGVQHRERDRQVGALLGAVAEEMRIKRGEDASVSPFEFFNLGSYRFHHR